MKIELDPEEEKPFRKKVWNGICLGTNFLLTVLYVIYAWQIGLAGFLSVALGILVGETGISAGDVICMLIPLFAIAAIIFAEIFRKKEWFIPAFSVHLAPLGLFGVAWLLL